MPEDKMPVDKMPEDKMTVDITRTQKMKKV